MHNRPDSPGVGNLANCTCILMCMRNVAKARDVVALCANECKSWFRVGLPTCKCSPACTDSACVLARENLHFLPLRLAPNDSLHRMHLSIVVPPPPRDPPERGWGLAHSRCDYQTPGACPSVPITTLKPWQPPPVFEHRWYSQEQN